MSDNKLITAFSKPRDLQEHLDSIHQASPLTALARIKQISANKDGYSPHQVLLILETALTREVRTNPQRRGVIQALKQAIKPAQKNVAAVTVPTEVMPAKSAVLTDAAKALSKLRDVIGKHEETFHAQTLGPRLQIGLQCLRAHQVFSIQEPGKRNKSGKNQHQKGHVTRDVASPEGFEGWLSTECQWLKKPTAYKYMTAVRGLGLDHTATEKQVAAALKIQLRKGPVSIASLCSAALEAIIPAAPEPEKLEQQEFNFLRQSLSAFREETESLCRLKEKLDAYPDFKRAATARLYSALVELTGTNWAPSDEPDSLANVDPDSIKL